MTMSIFANEAAAANVAGLGVNVDSGVFMGSYEALTDMKSSTRYSLCSNIVMV